MNYLDDPEIRRIRRYAHGWVTVMLRNGNVGVSNTLRKAIRKAHEEPSCNLYNMTGEPR